MLENKFIFNAKHSLGVRHLDSPKTLLSVHALSLITSKVNHRAMKVHMSYMKGSLVGLLAEWMRVSGCKLFQSDGLVAVQKAHAPGTLFDEENAPFFVRWQREHDYSSVTREKVLNCAGGLFKRLECFQVSGITLFACSRQPYGFWRICC